MTEESASAPPKTAGETTAPPPVGGEAPAVPKRTGPALEVLVVDDDAAARATLTAALTAAGHQPREAADAAAVRATLETVPPDVVLLPLRTATLDGLALLKEIRTARPETAVLLSPGQATMDEAVEAAGAGAADFLEQPIEPATLIKKLDETAAARQADNAEGAAEKATADDAEKKAVKSGAEVAAHPVELPALQPGTGTEPPATINRILDVPVQVTVLLGRTSMLVQDLLQLGPGGVVELDKRAGEPVELLVNNKLVAMGEVVVVNETFGVRVTTVVDPKQRVQSLR